MLSKGRKAANATLAKPARYFTCVVQVYGELLMLGRMHHEIKALIPTWLQRAALHGCPQLLGLANPEGAERIALQQQQPSP
jgi:hypothetical protein